MCTIIYPGIFYLDLFLPLFQVLVDSVVVVFLGELGFFLFRDYHMQQYVHWSRQIKRYGEK